MSNKQDRFKQWVVRYFKAAGFHAERTSPMQAGISNGHGDVLVQWEQTSATQSRMNNGRVLVTDSISRPRELRLECKHRAALPEYLWEPDPFSKRPVPQYLMDWLDGNDAVIFKGQGIKYPPMVYFTVLSNGVRCGHTIIPLAEYVEGLK